MSRARPAPPQAPPSHASALWTCLALSAATLAVYAPVWRYDAVDYDDLQYLFLNLHVPNGLTWAGARWAFSSAFFSNWMPLTWLSLMANVQFMGKNLGWMHLTNAGLHAASAGLLLWFLYRSTRALGRSAFVAAMFALHPLHVESVAWISERKDCLSAFFFMLSLLAYARYARLPSARRYLGVAALFAMSLMAKPMMVTLPCLLLLLDYWPLRRTSDGATWGKLVMEKVPLAALSAASSAVTMVAQRTSAAHLRELPLSPRLANAATSYVVYLFKAVWPTNLAVYYPYPARQSGWQMLACLFGLAAVSFAAYRHRQRRPYFPVGWFWYLGTLVPVIGLVQVGDQARADRYTYIPLVGAFIVVAWGCEELLERRPALRSLLAPAAVATVLACAAATRAQLSHWKDNAALWTRALAATKDNYVAETGMGGVMLAKGRSDEAIAHFRRAVALAPRFALAQNNIGATLLKYDLPAEAAAYLAHAIELEPGYAEAHSNLATALAGLGRLDEAIQHYKIALGLEPAYPNVLNNLGIVQARKGRPEEALASFNEALRLDPGLLDTRYNAAIVLFQLKRTSEAVRQLRIVVRDSPQNSDARRMLLDLERTAPGL